MDVCRNQWLCPEWTQQRADWTYLTTAALAVMVSLLTFTVWAQLRLWNESALQGIDKKRRQESVWVTNTISTTCPNLGWSATGWGALCFLRPCCPWFSRIWDFISSSWAQDNVKRCPRLTGKLGAACFSCPIWLDLDQQDLPKRWNTYFPGKNWKLFLHLWSYTEWLSETQ